MCDDEGDEPKTSSVFRRRNASIEASLEQLLPLLFPPLPLPPLRLRLALTASGELDDRLPPEGCGDEDRRDVMMGEVANEER